MALVVEKTTGGREYKVKDLSQADLGRSKIQKAEDEMPGLKACRAEFGHRQPFKSVRITICLTMTAQTAVLIDTLTALGAEVRWCSSNISSTQDLAAAAAIARDSASVFAWEGETLEEYWLCIERALDWGPGGGPDLVIDYGGDAIFFINEGLKAEEIYAKTGQLPDPSSSTDNAEFQIVLNMIRDGLKTDSMRYHNMKDGLVGVSEETTTGVQRLYQMQANGTLWFPAIGVNDSVTKSKFINLYGSRYAVLDGMRAINMMIAGKIAVVCGYEDASEGCAIALKQAGAHVFVSEVDPNHALQAVLRGFSVETLDNVVPKADIFVTAGINKGNIYVVDHVKKMKNNAIIYNTDPILDLNSNIYSGLEQYFPGMKHIIVNPQTDKWVFPDTNSCIIVLTNTGYPNLMLSWSCTSHVVAILDLWSKRGSGKYEKKVYVLSEYLEVKVSALHLPKLTAAAAAAAASVMMTTKKETKGQADHVLFVPIEEQGNGFITGTDEPKKNHKKKILIMGVQACSLFGIVVLGLTKASKVKMELSFCAIWG